MLTKNLDTNYRYACRGEGIEAQSKLMVAAKWWLLLQLQKAFFEMWCCPFPIYIGDIRCAIGLVSGIATKAAMASPKSFIIFQ